MPSTRITRIVPFFYKSGELINLGDRVSLHGEPGEIESVHDPAEGLSDWYVEMYGGGVIVAEPKVFGRLFIEAPVVDYDDLEFVCRGS